MKIKTSQNGETNMLFTDVGKSCQNRIFLTWQISLLTLFEKIKFSQKGVLSFVPMHGFSLNFAY